MKPVVSAFGIVEFFFNKRIVLAMGFVIVYFILNVEF
jgi:hypothetical protein